MKRILILALVFGLAVALVACGVSKKAVKESTPAISVEEPNAEVAPSEKPAEEVEVPEVAEEIKQLSDPLQVPGASLYRGVVTSINEKGFTLEQYVGTDFGRPTLNVLTNEDTRANYNADLLAEGHYIDVYYGKDLAATEIPDEVTAIAINFVGKTEDRVFNGIVKEINPLEGKPQEGSILLTDLNGENEIVFNYKNDGSTQFYLNFEEIKPGSKLNILHKPAMTKSLPPQVFAEEVRFFAEAA